MISKQQDRLDLSTLAEALASLKDGLEVVNDEQWFTQQSPKVQQTLISGVIKNFEFVYEISVKMLKRQLEMESATPHEIDEMSFRDQLRLAAEKGLIADVEAWFTYRYFRNLTSHTYNHEKAQEVYRGTQKFFLEVRDLFAALEKRHA